MQTPVLVRYRFRSLEQLQRHLHAADGRVLFFYRSPRARLAFGDRVVMEIAFDASEQSVLLRGSVLSTVDGPAPGVWLEFADSGLAGGKLEGGRKQRRLACDAMVQLQQKETRVIGRLLDVSMGGVRVDAPVELDPSVAVELRILGSDPSWPEQLGLAQLTRLGGGVVGLRFLRGDGKTRVAATKLFGAVQEAWARASEASHPPACCENGVHLDPSPPQLTALQKRHAQG